MKLIAPDYYPEFHCIADRCRHSCCIGWEIDIDEESLAYYRGISDEIGKRLRESIVEDGETAHFRLAAQERCPFLNAQGLCDLIIELGEDSLCQICADHPRFRSFFSDRTEIGLGLCCEEAARLILTRESPMRLVTLEDDGQSDELWEDDEAVLDLRDQLLSIAQDRTLPIVERVKIIGERCAADDPDLADWAAFLTTLERLDEAWSCHLATLSSVPEITDMTAACWEKPLEQLLVYLLLRHLPGALEDGMLRERAIFCLICWRVVREMCAKQEDAGIDTLIELARMFSSEIEYSDENVAAMLERIADA